MRSALHLSPLTTAIAGAMVRVRSGVFGNALTGFPYRTGMRSHRSIS